MMKDEVNISHEGYSLDFLGKDYANLIASIDTTTVIEPDFMYIVKKKDGKMSMNVVIETKDVNQETDLRPKESAKIDCAKLFFEQITKDNPSFPVSFERQINREKMNNIIDRLITSK